MATKQNTINVTACDNEIIILAYQNNASFELCRILSGFQFPVNVALTIAAGTNTGSVQFDGRSGPLNKIHTINLPSGAYSLLLLGINWGGGQQYIINVNGTVHGIQTYQPNGTSGLPYHSDPIAITV